MTCKVAHESPTKRPARAREGWLCPGAATLLAACAVPPTAPRRADVEAPFAAPRASFLHAAVLVPPLQRAATLEPGTVHLRARSAHASSHAQRTIAGISNRFEGVFHEWLGLEAAWGAVPHLELTAATAYAGWDEHEDRFSLFDAAGTPIVRDEAGVIFGTASSKRHDNVSSLTLGAKRSWLAADEHGVDLALAAAVKLPVGRSRDLTHAGTEDVSLTTLVSVPLPFGTLHANAGATVPFGSQDLFVPAAGVDLEPFAHGGVGLSARLAERWAAGLQLEANGSAFRDVEFLRDPPVALVSGVRRVGRRLDVELGAGFGLERDSTYDWLAFAAVTVRL
jgi:hypothetical protein